MAYKLLVKNFYYSQIIPTVIDCLHTDRTNHTHLFMCSRLSWLAVTFSLRDLCLQ